MWTPYEIIKVAGTFWQKHIIGYMIFWEILNLQEWWQWWAISESWGCWRWPEMIECWLKGFVQKWGRLVPIYGQNALNPWKFCCPTFGQACAYLGASKICAFSLLIYMQAKHVVTYLTMVKGAHISSHFFSDNIGEPWLRKAMAAETHGFGHEVSHCRGLARHCRRGRGQAAKRRFTSMMCFPSFLEWWQPQIIPD